MGVVALGGMLAGRLLLSAPRPLVATDVSVIASFMIHHDDTLKDSGQAALGKASFLSEETRSSSL